MSKTNFDKGRQERLDKLRDAMIRESIPTGLKPFVHTPLKQPSAKQPAPKKSHP